MTAPDFSVRDVLQWARTKPAGRTYNYADLDNCILAQFVCAMGLSLDGDDRDKLERGDAGTAACLSRTFGAFVTRLEALCPDTPPSEWTRVDAYMEKVS